MQLTYMYYIYFSIYHVVFELLSASDLEICLGSDGTFDYLLVKITSQVQFLIVPRIHHHSNIHVLLYVWKFSMIIKYMYRWNISILEGTHPFTLYVVQTPGHCDWISLHELYVNKNYRRAVFFRRLQISRENISREYILRFLNFIRENRNPNNCYRRHMI